MKRFFILMTVLVALLTGCDPQTGTDAGNGGGTGNNTPSGGGNGGAAGTAAAELVSMDIADAESIYISTPTEAGETVSAKAGVTARTIGERAAARGFFGSVLFKITKEGKAVEISLTWGNDKNENTAQLRPVAVHEAGPDYVITEFYNPTIRQSIAYLINKKSGKAYSLEEVGVPQPYGNPATLYPLIYTDKEKHIYYKTLYPYPRNGKNYDIVRIDVSDVNKINVKSMTLPQDFIELSTHPESNNLIRFIVAEDGHLIYDKVVNDDIKGSRAIFSNGKFSSMTESLMMQNEYRAPDGNIYSLDFGSGSILQYKFDTEKGTVTSNSVSIGLSLTISGVYTLVVDGELLQVSGTGYNVVYSSTMSNCRSKSFPDLNVEIDCIAAADSSYYISGRDTLAANAEALFKITPAGEGILKNIPVIDEEGIVCAIYQMSYSQTNKQLTIGVVNANGEYRIGRLDVKTDKIISWLEIPADANITYLTPIN